VPSTSNPDQISRWRSKAGRPAAETFLERHQETEAVELVAVNQCSGNSRGFSNPRRRRRPLGNGAMGNARWRACR